MKKRAFILALVLVLLTQLSLVHASGELLQNGGVEEGSGPIPDGWGYWSTAGDSPFTWDSSVAHSGSKSIKIQNAEQIPSTWGQTFTDLVPGKEYVFSGWIKTENVVMAGHQGAQLATQMKDANGNIIFEAESESLHGDNDWTYVELRFTPPEGIVEAGIQCRLWGASGTAWWDDVSFKPADAVEEKPAENSGAQDSGSTPAPNPKTGDFSVIPYVAAAAASMVVLRKRQK